MTGARRHNLEKGIKIALEYNLIVKKKGLGLSGSFKLPPKGDRKRNLEAYQNAIAEKDELRRSNSMKDVAVASTKSSKSVGKKASKAASVGAIGKKSGKASVVGDKVTKPKKAVKATKSEDHDMVKEEEPKAASRGRGAKKNDAGTSVTKTKTATSKKAEEHDSTLDSSTDDGNTKKRGKKATTDANANKDAAAPKKGAKKAANTKKAASVKRGKIIFNNSFYHVQTFKQKRFSSLNHQVPLMLISAKQQVRNYVYSLTKRRRSSMVIRLSNSRIVTTLTKFESFCRHLNFNLNYLSKLSLKYCFQDDMTRYT